MNHQIKTTKTNSLSLSLVKDNFLRFLKGTSVFIAAIALVAGGFFAPSSALAAATVTPASGGTNISIDKTSALGGSGIYTTLSGPSITETTPGDISVGTHVITLPAGWEFNTGLTVKVVRTGGNLLPAAQTAVLTGNTLTFTITQSSTANSSLAIMLDSFEGIQVRPTGNTPSTDEMTHSGAAIAGVTNGSTSFGTLSTVPGTVTKLAFETQPGVTTVYGSNLSTQPVVKTQDQFGNDSASGLAATETVTLKLNGSGTLQGTLSQNIGTGGGNGTATFTNLTVNLVGTGNTITATPST